MATGTDARPSRSRLLGGLLLWFGTLGGAVAWAVHVTAAWSTDELVCASGHQAVFGTSLQTVLLLMSGIPLAVALAATGVSFVAWRRVSRAQHGESDAGSDPGEERSLGRAALMAQVGLAANLLFVAMIVFGGAVVAVYPVCRR